MPPSKAATATYSTHCAEHPIVSPAEIKSVIKSVIEVAKSEHLENTDFTDWHHTLAIQKLIELLGLRPMMTFKYMGCALRNEGTKAALRKAYFEELAEQKKGEMQKKAGEEQEALEEDSDEGGDSGDDV